MNYPAASCGVSKAHHANASHSVTPEFFSPGVQIRIGLDSRLKHAGMTDFGLAVAKTQQAAGNQPQAIERLEPLKQLEPLEPLFGMPESRGLKLNSFTLQW